jgi:aminomethyltransferase
MGERTPLYARHLKDGAKIVDFGGWDMPLHYGSQLQEHHQVRGDAGMFDVSHMAITDLASSRTKDFLRYLLANDVARIKNPGKALYSCMLNERGGVIDDLIVYYLDDSHYRVVSNAGTRAKDLAWIRRHAEAFGVNVQPRAELAMVAVQGPQARAKTLPLLPAGLQQRASQLGVFYAAWEGEWMVARTGYTGEDGFEIMLPASEVEDFWVKLTAAGVKPAGLGARDTLRLEAGMCLYGTDMDETTTPCESALSWTVAWQPEDRDFIGRAAIAEQQRGGAERLLVGLVLKGKGVLRGHQKVNIDGVGTGEITSGTFSPTLGVSIALARIPAGLVEEVTVNIRDSWQAARIVKPPFARHGKACIEM